jgi:hypothetical protein
MTILNGKYTSYTPLQKIHSLIESVSHNKETQLDQFTTTRNFTILQLVTLQLAIWSDLFHKASKHHFAHACIFPVCTSIEYLPLTVLGEE